MKRTWHRLAIGATVGALVLVATATRSEASSAGAKATSALWTVVASPTLSDISWLNSVSCVSASFCVAVGYVGTNQEPLIEAWNGTSWSVIPSPEHSGAGAILNGVSCVSASFCMAVGWTTGDVVSLIEVWNGTVWSVVSNGTGSLYGVSCIWIDLYMTVGDASAGSPTGLSYLEASNGTSWSYVNERVSGFLDGVSCVSANSCMAVGLTGSLDAGTRRPWPKSGTARHGRSSPPQQAER